MDLQTILTMRERLHEQVHRVVVGQDRAIDLMLIALFCQGHVLIEGVPGTAKTLLARSFAAALKLDFKRIQFTPDLMPGDVLGTNLFDFRTNQFTLTKGPIFTELLLADEINRAPPKTQAALLQAMQERSVTIDGKRHTLGSAFMVLATQNPIEQEGTYPLPEAQLDRFLFKIDIRYPTRDQERAIVKRHGHGTAMPSLERFGVEAVGSREEIETARETVAAIRIADEIVDYVVDIVRATRENASLLCGASPRAANMLAAGATALAAVQGREFVIPDDVKALAVSTLAHRVLLAPEAEIEGLDERTVVRRVVDEIEAPR
ncbi:MAG: AAA family ATPase [Planctomycetota bacterium]